MIMKICLAMLTFVVFCCLAAKAAVKTTAISILTTNSNGTRTATIPPQTTTNSGITLKVISSSQAISEEKTTPTRGPPATANTETRTPPSMAGTESTTNESTEPDISTAKEQTVPSRRPPSSGDTESTTNESTEPGTSPAASDIVGVHDLQRKGRVARVNVIYVIAGVAATLIIIGGAIAAALFYFRRDRNRSNSEEEGLAVTFTNVKKAVSTPDINRKYGTNNNEHYSEITKPDKRCTSSKTFENRVDEFNAYEEVKDRVNPLYNSSNVPNAYEELKENKNPLYSGSVNTENAKKNNDPVYDRISVWIPRKQRK